MDEKRLETTDLEETYKTESFYVNIKIFLLFPF